MAELVRAAVQAGPRQIEIREFPRPVTGPEDGLLRVEACGICGSDVETYKGHLGRGVLPMIPGHEPLGIVEEVGERAAARWGVRAGDRVALEILIPCRSCDLCLAGRYMSCPNRHGSYGYSPLSRAPSLWGGFADYVYLHPNAILHKVSSDIPAEVAVMFNPLGAGVRWASHLGGTQLGDTVLILGPGQRGLCAVIAARAAGAGTIIVSGLARDRAKLELAREFGADHTINVDTEDTVERVRDITGGRLADIVLELTPMAAEPVRDALRAVRHGGRVVLAGLKGDHPVELHTDLIINKAITVVGAYGVDSRAYGEAIRIIEAGQVPLHRLHTHTFELADTTAAIETLAGEIPGEQAVHVAIRPGHPAAGGTPAPARADI
jgi:threonine dehydrogenase-like Zn-dependent dehydrogenase